MIHGLKTFNTFHFFIYRVYESLSFAAVYIHFAYNLFQRVGFMCLGLGMLISCVFGFVFGLILGTTEMPWGQNADWPTEEMRGRWVQSISITVSINANHPNNCNRLQRICHVVHTQKETKLCSQEFSLKGKLISWEFLISPSIHHN